ncbi:hypothetical protein D1007_50694 [Hordeum vulgare]|nr:hypothetical protein D1007_50694 [Hordeum vulgare]
MQHPRVAPTLPRVPLAPPLVRASQHPTHRHVALLVAYELRRQRTAVSEVTCVTSGSPPQEKPDIVPAWAMSVSPRRWDLQQKDHTSAPQTSITAPQGIRQEWMGVQDSAQLGGRHPEFLDTLHVAGREYERPVYINPRGLTRGDDNHTSTPTRRGGDPAGHHYSRMYERDPTNRPRTKRYEQCYGGDPRGWLREGAQRGYARGAHLLVGSCLR